MSFMHIIFFFNLKQKRAKLVKVTVCQKSNEVFIFCHISLIEIKKKLYSAEKIGSTILVLRNDPRHDREHVTHLPQIVSHTPFIETSTSISSVADAPFGDRLIYYFPISFFAPGCLSTFNSWSCLASLGVRTSGKP